MPFATPDPLRADYRSAFVENPRRREHLANHDTALMCIDLQYLDAARGEGLFADPEHVSSLDGHEYYFDRLEQIVLPNIRRLQDTFRDHDLEVIHCRICALTSDGRDRSAGHKRLKLHAPPGSHDAEFLEIVKPAEDEIVINKTASGVFSSTNLGYVLNNLGIRSLYIVGVYTNECVETTARDACDLGYFVTIIDDACATVTPQLHEASLATLRDRYARIGHTAPAVAEIETTFLRTRAGLAIDGAGAAEQLTG